MLIGHPPGGGVSATRHGWFDAGGKDSRAAARLPRAFGRPWRGRSNAGNIVQQWGQVDSHVVGYCHGQDVLDGGGKGRDGG